MSKWRYQVSRWTTDLKIKERKAWREIVLGIMGTQMFFKPRMKSLPEFVNTEKNSNFYGLFCHRYAPLNEVSLDSSDPWRTMYRKNSTT